MRNLLYPILSGILLLSSASGAASTPELALRAAIQKEAVDGDLEGAIRMYAAIAESGNPVIAAQALLRMGSCYEKLGDPKARTAYERVIVQFASQKEAVREARDRLAALPDPQDKRAPLPGWYNGDWQSGIPGLSNWYRGPQEFARVYDDFSVPAGGWTIAAVFSNNRMDFDGVTKASWEIRKGMAPHSAGHLVASGLSPASQTMIPGNGPFPRDPQIGYRVQVDGLRVQLAPGKYWLSVTPLGSGESFVSATRGRNSIGEPPGDNGMAFYDSSRRDLRFEKAETVGRGGQLGIGSDFSQGVLILGKSR
jgi:hypothetical protein